MKSSWKKQRLATKKRSINRNKWVRRALREYGFKSLSELSEKLAQAIITISKTFAKVVIGIEQWFKDNLICSHKWKPTDSYLIDICEYCGMKRGKAALSPNVGSMSTPSVAPVLRETVYTPKGIMYKDDLQRKINKHLNIPTLFKSTSR
ncbi:hypothetical protein [Lactococcus petauri]|uniref:hypothetical protein n=1 Tax=Lactococcus petauri TaxID=1940789 RepID=UPI0018AA8C6C|nr:hypothetical protein [Lactococcus petauri]